MTLTLNDFYTSSFGDLETGSYHYIGDKYEFYITYFRNGWHTLGIKNNKNHTIAIPDTPHNSAEECLELINNFLNK